MSTDLRNPAELEHFLWDEIERRPVGMLMLVGGPRSHAQPMTAFVEREDRRLWFFASMDSDLVMNARPSQAAMFVWQQRDTQACIIGRLDVQRDRSRMSHFWNAVVAAWYPKGQSDPRLTMLTMACEDAQVWVSTAGPLRAVWEIAKANASRRPPQMGEHGRLTFH